MKTIIMLLAMITSGCATRKGWAWLDHKEYEPEKVGVVTYKEAFGSRDPAKRDAEVERLMKEFCAPQLPKKLVEGVESKLSGATTGGSAYASATSYNYKNTPYVKFKCVDPKLTLYGANPKK